MSYSFAPTAVADFDSTTVDGGCSFALSGGKFAASISGGGGARAFGTKDVFGVTGTEEFWLRFNLAVGPADPSGSVCILKLLDTSATERFALLYEQGVIFHEGHRFEAAWDGGSPSAMLNGNLAPELGGPSRTIEIYANIHGSFEVFLDGQLILEQNWEAVANPIRYIQIGIVDGADPLDYVFDLIGIRNDRDANYWGLDDAGMSLVVHEGFEHGTPSDKIVSAIPAALNNYGLSTTAPVIDSGTARGTYSLKCDSRSDADARYMGWSDTSDLVLQGHGIGRPPKAAMSLYVYLSTLPDADTRLAGFEVVKNDQRFPFGAGHKTAGSIILDPDGNLWADANGGDNSRTFGICIVEHLGEWIHLDLALDTVPQNWTLDWAVNGVAMPQDLAIPGGYFAGESVNILGALAGIVSGADRLSRPPGRMLMYVDDLAVSRDHADFPVGPIRHSLKVPTAVGTHVGADQYVKTTDNLTTVTALSGADTTSYQDIDEWPPTFGSTADGVAVYSVFVPGTPPFGSDTWQVSIDSYLEYTLGDATAVPLAVNLWLAQQQKHTEPFTDESITFVTGGNLRPYEASIVGFAAGTDGGAASWCQPRAPDGTLWSEASWNATLLRYGYCGLFVNGVPPTKFELACAIAAELLFHDTELDPLPATPQCGEIPPPPVGGSLGCGDYQLSIWNRGLDFMDVVLPDGAVTWERVIDDTSTASVTIEGFGIGALLNDALDVGCGGETCFADPWSNELVVHRRNSSLAWIREWSGPIQKITLDPEGQHATIEARDVTAWWDKRRIHLNHLRGKRDPLTNVYSQEDDVGTLFKRYADDAMQPDNTPGIVVDTVLTGILAIHPVRRDQFLIAADTLRELSQSGVDWTAVDRTIHIGADGIAGTGIVGPIYPHHLAAQPIVEVDGASAANNWVVKGDGGGPGGVSVNSTPDVDGVTQDLTSISFNGLLEGVANTKAQSNIQANADAESRLELTKEPLVIVREVRLLPTAPFPMAILIPGSQAVLNLAPICNAIPGSQRIERVHVAHNERGEEVVVLTFMPPGTVPAE